MNFYSGSDIVYYEEGDYSLERSSISVTLKDTFQVHTIIEGQSLMSISGMYYKGDISNWQLIGLLNEIIDPFDLIPGTDIKIPILQ